MRTAGGGWTDVNVYRRNSAGTGWDLVSLGLPNLTTSGSGSVTDTVNEPAPATRIVTNGNVSVSTTGGFGPFTYTWTRIGGSSAMTVNNGSVRQPVFSATVNKNSTVAADWRCTVYDTQSGRSESIDRTINLSYFTNL